MSRLTPADRDRIIALLAADQPLPASDRDLLFPPSNESNEETPAGALIDEGSARANIPPEQTICFSLYSTSLAISKTYWPILGRFGLTYPQLLALRHIHDGITVNELGAILYLDSGTLTPLLKRLESAGHVRRERDPKDERRVRLYLTEQGTKLRDDSVNELRGLLAHVSGWPQNDLRKLASQVSRFRAALLSREGDTARVENLD